MNIEPLETRIAPAVFFLSGTALTVEDAAGNDAETLPNEIVARTAAGATKAVLLQVGDMLVFDEDNDNVRDAQERVLVEVTAGRALVFLSDGFGPTAGAFDENEISGLAVSDGFKGKIRTDVNGSIATTLDAAGTFTGATLQGGSIAELKIAGRVLGSVVAGKNVSNVAIGSGLFTATAEASAEALGAGTGAVGTLARFSFSGAVFNLVFDQPVGAAGGSIANVRLENGAALVRAGDGGDVRSGAGNGGAGGSITGLLMIDAPAHVEVLAGNGGISLSGAGGAGGAIVDSSIVFTGSTGAESFVRAGGGGFAPTGVAGAGGSIVRTTVHQLGDGLGLRVSGGTGQDASGAGGIGGAGGSITASTVIVAGDLGVVAGTVLNRGALRVSSGGGGFGSVRGGAGGAITGSTIEALGADSIVPFFSVSAGGGGGSDGGPGGAGGAVAGNTILATARLGITVNAENLGATKVEAGNGGDGITAGGVGGALTGNDIQLLNGVTLANGNALTIAAGAGGGVDGAGTGGAGGAASNNRVRLGTVNLLTTIAAGAGGADETPADSGSGGKGGALTGLTLETIGTLSGLRVVAGDGGAAGTTGSGGAGGALSALTTDLRGTVFDSFFIAAGSGGAGGTVQGQGGVGGAFAASTIKVDDISTSFAFLRAGDAGTSRGASSLAGGALTGVVFENVGRINSLNIRAGSGGDILAGAGTTGGNGALDGLTISNLGGADSIRIGGGDQANHAGVGNGGNQGIVKNVTVHNLAALNTLDILGNSGGFAGAGGGNGGNGGAVKKITINDPAGIAGAVTIGAGPGGRGRGASAVGGVGGGVSEITLSGPDTRFTLEAGDGGDGATLGGKGGAVSLVSGTIREANLFAGDGGTASVGTGGAGGKVGKIDFTRVGDFVRRIVAGDGGDGATLGGVGGAIDDVRVRGDIGDFDASFGAGDTAMGGLFAGQAGLGGAPANGSVSKISATRIAAILAGTPAANALTAANAVHSLTQISAFIIGADVAQDGDFDIVNAGAPGFGLGQGDSVIDGLVIARLESQVHALPVRPLFAASLVAAAAPAANLGGTFFLSANALTVKDAAGNDAQNTAAETAAQTAAGSTRAIFMQRGQTLVFDENDNLRRDPQERVLVSVAGGSAIVFLSDGFGPTAGAFDENEISGLAVSHGFKGTIRSDVNGSITTTLDATGNFTPTTLQLSAISTLTVAGRVAGFVATGRGMAMVDIGSGLFTLSAEPSAAQLLTGSAADGETATYSRVLGFTTLDFTQPAATAGGSISKVRLDNGATTIRAGNGGDAAAGAGNGGAGGGISKLLMVDAGQLLFVGAGFGGTSVSGVGGAGGSIGQSTLVFDTGGTATTQVLAGGGGFGRTGGAGGAIRMTTVHQLEDGRSLQVRAGFGEASAGDANVGGAGGAISASAIFVAGSLGAVSGGAVVGGDLFIAAGGGGSGTRGGVGGAIGGSTVRAFASDGVLVDVSIIAGQGGDSSAGAGAAGGAISGSTVQISAPIGLNPGTGSQGHLGIAAGGGGASSKAGGTGGVGGAMLSNRIHLLGDAALDVPAVFTAGIGGDVVGTSGGAGGKGGAFSGNTLRLAGEVAAAVQVSAGDGGGDSTTSDAGNGGAGGALTALQLHTYSLVQGLTVAAGLGGSAGAGGAGGAGGALTDATLVLGGTVDGELRIAAGSGGQPAGTVGAGGAGGALARVAVSVVEVTDDVSILAGDATNSRDRAGRNGGNLSDVTFTNRGLIEDLFIVAGAGGALDSGTGEGGTNGKLSRVVATNLGGLNRFFIGENSARSHSGTGDGVKGAAASDITVHNFSTAAFAQITGGIGGRGGALGGDGGAGASLSRVVFHDPAGVTGPVIIFTAQMGNGQGATGRGAASGSVSDVRLDGPATDFRVVAASGGDGAVAAGKGGSVSQVRGVVGELRVQAGGGGSATNAGTTGAAGGSVSAVEITAVRDFVRHIIAGDGGEGGALGGTGGSIDGVTVAGDLGNFDANFGIFRMDGLFAGLAGSGSAQNGSIANVTATRIATIVAGRPAASAVTAANAVHSLTAITTFILGADVNADGVFAFTNAGPAGFALGQGDTALDGLILTRRATDLAALPVRPLFSIVP